MKTRLANDLVIINILSVLLILIIVFLPDSVLRVILGLPFVLLFPGYSFIAALFPGKDAIKGIERIALSCGTSLALVILTGFILNYTPWGIRLYPIVISLELLNIVLSVIAWYRRRLLPEEDRFHVSFSFSKAGWLGKSRIEKMVSISVIVIFIIALGVGGYYIITPKASQNLTEFYLLGPDGKAENYPREIPAGQDTEVTFGIVNRETETVSYYVEVRIDDTVINTTEVFALQNEEKYEQIISFTPSTVGIDQKVEFVLVKNNEDYRQLYLWIDVPY